MRISKSGRMFLAATAALAVLSLTACGNNDSDGNGDSGQNNELAANLPETCTQSAEFPVVEQDRTTDTPWKIAVILPHTQEGYSQSIDYGANERIKELGVDGTVSDAGGYQNIDDQIGMVDAAITKGVDAVVVWPADPEALAPVMKKAHEAGIKVLGFVDPGGKNAQDWSAYPDIDVHFAGDYYQNAYDVTTCLAEAVDATGQFYLIQGGAGSTYQEEENQGVKDALANFPDMELVAEKALPDFSTSGAQSGCEDALTAHPDIKVIYSATMSMAAGCANAIAADGKTGQIALGATDPTSADDPEGLRDGRYTIVLGQRPVFFGRGAVDLAVQLLEGNAPAGKDQILSQTDLYTDGDTLEEELPNQLAPSLIK